MEGSKKKSLWRFATHFLSKKRLTPSTDRQQNSPDLLGISSYGTTSTSSSIDSVPGITLHTQSKSIGPSSASTELLTSDKTPENVQKESSPQFSGLNAFSNEALESSEIVNNSEKSRLFLPEIMLTDCVENVEEHAVELLQSHIQNLKSAAASSVDDKSRDDIPLPPDTKSAILKLNQSSTLLFRILSVLSDQWNPDVDLPTLDKTNLDESIENASNAIKKIIDANDQVKAEDAAKTGILHTFAENAKSICIHLKPFFKTFLSVGIHSSAVRSPVRALRNLHTIRFQFLIPTA